jgi:hypothetical protein
MVQPLQQVTVPYTTTANDFTRAKTFESGRTTKIK